MSLSQAWVFQGASARFPSGIFLSREKAEQWIKINALTGILTAYPVDIGVYDWAIARGTFTPKKEQHKSARFRQRFTSAQQEHYHYEAGQCAA